MKISSTLLVIALSAFAVSQSNAQNTIGPSAPQVYLCVGNLLGLVPTVTAQTTPCPVGTEQGQISGTAWSAEINVDGTIKSGSNFVGSVSHVANSGVYSITFTSAFPRKPECTETLTGQDNNLGVTDVDDGESETTSGVAVATTSFADDPPPPEGGQYVDLPFKITCTLPQ